MLVLVATKNIHDGSSGGAAVPPVHNAADYSDTVEGELVTPVVAACATPDQCGCARGFPGFASGRATTTAMVVDLPHVSEADLREVVDGALERDGWFELVDEHERHELVDEHVECIVAVCQAFPVGSIVGRHGDLVYDRSIARAA